MAFFNKRHQAIYLLLFITMLVQNHVIAQPLTARQIDSITLKAMKAFNVPGMSVGIVKDGKVAYIKGLWGSVS